MNQKSLTVCAMTALLIFSAQSGVQARDDDDRKRKGKGKDRETSESVESVPDDPVDAHLSDLAAQIVASLNQENKSKIAVVEFSDLNGSISELGQFIAEELITRLYRSGNFEVVERQLLTKVIDENMLKLSGLIDETSAKELGRILGVDAIATGSITDLGASVKINARLISTETGSIFAVAATPLPKSESVVRLMSHRTAGTGAGAAGQEPAAGPLSRREIGNAASASSPSPDGGFVDDFKPSIGKYRFSNPSQKNPMAKYYFNDDAGRLEIRSADNVEILISGDLPVPTKAGRVVVTFCATKTFPHSGTIGINVTSTGGDGYRFLFPRSYYDSRIEYLVGGKSQLVWDRKGDSFELNQKHTMTLEYSPERIIGLFDGVKIFDVRNEHEYTVSAFAIGVSQMDLYIDSLEVE